MRNGSPYEQRPSCVDCSTEMWLLSSDPHPELATHDQRLYECPVCKILRVLVVDRWAGTPLTSKWT